MKRFNPILLLIMALLLLPALTSINYAQLSFEVGPSYIVNMSDYTWENAAGLNICLNYQFAENLYLSPKLSVYKFPAGPASVYYVVPQQAREFFPLFSLNDDEVGFVDLSIGLRTGPTNRIINPLFSLRTGLHFVRYTDNYRLPVLHNQPADEVFRGPYQTQKISETIGFASIGFGLLINLSNRVNLIAESSFSGSFHYDYIFIPVDLMLRINL